MSVARGKDVLIVRVSDQLLAVDPAFSSATIKSGTQKDVHQS
jgi:hypothetical protein